MAAERDFKKIIQNSVRDNESIPQIQFILQDDVEIEEISGKGVMNYVFRVHSKDQNQSVVIKYGEEQAKVPIEGLDSLSLDRQKLEFDSLVLMAEICPGSVPKPYCYDDKHHIVVMEDLKDMEVLGAQLSEGNVDAESAARIGKLLATIHNKTSHRLVSKETWQHLQTLFTQQAIKDMFKSFTCVEPFREESPLAVIPDGGIEIYRQCVTQIKSLGLQEKLMMLHDVNECFIHADSHWNHFAIFPGSERIAMFDFEFAYIGNPCYNLGYALLGYPLYYHALGDRPESERLTFRKKAQHAVAMTVDAYLAETEIYKDRESQAAFVSSVALEYGSNQFALSLYGGLDLFLPITAKQKIQLMENANHVMQIHLEINTSEKLAQALFWEPSMIG